MGKSAKSNVKSFSGQMSLSKTSAGMASLSDASSLVGTGARSDHLVKALLSQGLTPERIAKKLGEMMDATETKRAFKHDPKLRRMVEIEEEKPAWRPQAQAIKFLIEVYGFVFSLPPGASVEVNVNTLQIAKDVSGMRPEDVLKELPGAVKVLEALPEAMNAVKGIVEAEVLAE